MEEMYQKNRFYFLVLLTCFFHLSIVCASLSQTESLQDSAIYYTNERDNLFSISHYLYGDSLLWPAIYALNPDLRERFWLDSGHQIRVLKRMPEKQEADSLRIFLVNQMNSQEWYEFISLWSKYENKVVFLKNRIFPDKRVWNFLVSELKEEILWNAINSLFQVEKNGVNSYSIIAAIEIEFDKLIHNNSMSSTGAYTKTVSVEDSLKLLAFKRTQRPPDPIFVGMEELQATIDSLIKEINLYRKSQRRLTFYIGAYSSASIPPIPELGLKYTFNRWIQISANFGWVNYSSTIPPTALYFTRVIKGSFRFHDSLFLSASWRYVVFEKSTDTYAFNRNFSSIGIGLGYSFGRFHLILGGSSDYKWINASEESPVQSGSNEFLNVFAELYFDLFSIQAFTR